MQVNETTAASISSTPILQKTSEAITIQTCFTIKPNRVTDLKLTCRLDLVEHKLRFLWGGLCCVCIMSLVCAAVIENPAAAGQHHNDWTSLKSWVFTDRHCRHRGDVFLQVIPASNSTNLITEAPVEVDSRIRSCSRSAGPVQLYVEVVQPRCCSSGCSRDSCKAGQVPPGGVAWELMRGQGPHFL